MSKKEIKIEIYDPKAGYKFMICPRCVSHGKTPIKRWCCQHHVERKRNSDNIVWVCSNGGPGFYPDACHQEIHNNYLESIKEGYLVKFNNTYMKKAKKKACKHGSLYYSVDDESYKCQFCGKLIKEHKLNKKKKK